MAEACQHYDAIDATMAAMTGSALEAPEACSVGVARRCIELLRMGTAPGALPAVHQLTSLCQTAFVKEVSARSMLQLQHPFRPAIGPGDHAPAGFLQPPAPQPRPAPALATSPRNAWSAS